MDNEKFSVKELAEMLKKTIRTIQQWAKDGKFQFVEKINRISYYKFSQNANNLKTQKGVKKWTNQN